ncbi:MAG: hypothetical protein KAQ99_06730, partial [Candidatus Aureabacteria bacterium]|nr:hypothetical protein [Candidatus Auribacterota bacterium]
VDDNTGEPLEGDEGEGEMLGTETYTGGGEWQKLSWYYGDVPEANDIKVVYIYPHANLPDDGGSLYMDNLNVETLAPPEGFPWLPDFIVFLDNLIEQLLEKELDIQDIITILTGVGAAHYLIKFLKDHLEGMKSFTQMVKDWRGYVNEWAVNHPNHTFFGLLWSTRGIFALESLRNMQTAFLSTAPMTEQAIYSIGFGLGYYLSLNLAFGNLSRLMISQFLDKLLLERNIAYEDYSAGIPDSQRIIASFPGIYIDLQQIQDAEGNLVDSVEETRRMFREDIFGTIREAIVTNMDPNNNIIWQYNSDSKGPAGAIEIEEAQYLIDWLKVNHPNVKFVWMHRKPVYYELIGAKGQKRGWELKGGAIVQTLQWVENAIPGEGYREVGAGKVWDGYLGTHTVEEVFGVEASPVPIANYFFIDTGDYPGPEAVIRMAEACGSPENLANRYISYAPDCIIGNTEDAMITRFFGKARIEMRSVERAIWKLFAFTPSYGKFGGKIAQCWDVWKDHQLPEQTILGEDLPLCLLLSETADNWRVGYAEKSKILESGPLSLIAELMTAIKWSYQDWTTAPLGGFNIKLLPYFTDKIKTVSDPVVTPFKDMFERWRIRSNLFARLGDPALLSLIAIDLMAKMNPGYISAKAPEAALVAYAASMISLVLLPRIDAWYKEGGVRAVAERIIVDFPTLTMMMLSGMMTKTWHLAKGIEAYRKNDCVFNIPRPSLTEYQFKPDMFAMPEILGGDASKWKRSIIGNTWRELALSWSIVGYAIASGEPLVSWYSAPIFLSWGGAAQTAAWITARNTWKEAFADIETGSEALYDWIQALIKKARLQELMMDETTPVYPLTLLAGGVEAEGKECIGTLEDIAEALWVTYDLTEGTYTLHDGDIQIAELKYELSEDGQTILINKLTAEGLAPLVSSEAARWLIIYTFERIYSSNRLRDPQPADPVRIAGINALPDYAWAALVSLSTDGYLSEPITPAPIPGYITQQILNADGLASAPFTVGGLELPKSETYSFTENEIPKETVINWDDSKLLNKYSPLEVIDVRGGLKDGLFDAGLISQWMDAEFATGSTVDMTLMYYDDFKEVYEVLYKISQTEHFTFTVINQFKAGLPSVNSLEYVIGDILVPVDTHWGLLPEGERGIPKPGGLVDLFDREIMTTQFISYVDRANYLALSDFVSKPVIDKVNDSLRKEACALYQIWKATGEIPQNLISQKVRYFKDAEGAHYAVFIDLGETTEVAGLGDLFTHATDVMEGFMPLKGHIAHDYAPDAPVMPDNAYAIAGFGDAMLLDGMTLDEVETLINSAITSIDYIAVDKAINILRGLTTILTRADLLSSGVHESVINQFELTALRRLFHGTANDDGIGSVLTYTGALGFVEVSEGIYQAEVINTAYVLAGYSIEEMAAYYTNPDPNQNPWASRGWTLADFTAPYSGGQAVTGVEDYDFGTGTAHITYYGMILDDYLMKLGLFDEGLLEEWIGKPLPGSFDLNVI